MQPRSSIAKSTGFFSLVSIVTGANPQDVAVFCLADCNNIHIPGSSRITCHRIWQRHSPQEIYRYGFVTFLRFSLRVSSFCGFSPEVGGYHRDLHGVQG